MAPGWQVPYQYLKFIRREGCKGEKNPEKFIFPEKISMKNKVFCFFSSKTGIMCREPTILQRAKELTRLGIKVGIRGSSKVWHIWGSGTSTNTINPSNIPRSKESSSRDPGEQLQTGRISQQERWEQGANHRDKGWCFRDGEEKHKESVNKLGVRFPRSCGFVCVCLWQSLVFGEPWGC